MNGKKSQDVVLKPVGDHFVSVRRLLITPTTTRGLTAQWCVGNRVVRQFGSDRFIRVIIRDEDLSLLSAANRLRKPIGVIIDILRRDLIIGDRRYHFLGCSNSQMREHGVWMYAGDRLDGGHTVDAIRLWMGDLTRERCVATYMSRLGQFFTATRKAIEVDRVDEVEDIWNNGYCFTDGIGKISPLLAKKVGTLMSVLSRCLLLEIGLWFCCVLKLILCMGRFTKHFMMMMMMTMTMTVAPERILNVWGGTRPAQRAGIYFCAPPLFWLQV